MAHRLRLYTFTTCVLVTAFILSTSGISQTGISSPSTASTSSTKRSLEQLVNEAARETIASFAAKGFKESNLAITLIDLRVPERPIRASFRGDVPTYPASVIKLFYLAAAHRWLEDKKLQESEELKRALRDMIVESSNDATHYVVDVLTGTTGGPELPASEAAEWAYKRNAVNRYFAALGYSNININQKPWCEGPFGRERHFLGPKFENRNKLTTEATARLLTEIVTRRAVTQERSAAMMDLLKRDPFAENVKDPDSQAKGFTGIALKQDARLWSKAGWTSTTRHDAAYVELPREGVSFVLVTFTTDFSREREIIPSVARFIIDNLRTVTPAQ